MTPRSNSGRAASLSVMDTGSAPIVFGAPDIGEEEIAEVVDTLRSGWIGTGPKTHLFERRFAEFLGARSAIGTNSATAALHLALDCLGVQPGDEVITTPMTFVATANVIEHCGARPVFVDVLPGDGNIDPAAVHAARTARTKAVLPVHYGGALVDVGSIREACTDIPIVVDSAHAVEARFVNGDSSAGNGATCTAYSFYVTKNLVTGEGGMLVTDNRRLERSARNRSLHGLNSDAWERFCRSAYSCYDLEYPGYKYNMTDVQASLGLHQLAKLQQASQRREQIWKLYNEGFADLDGVEIPPVALRGNGVGSHARHLYTLWFDWDTLGLSREQLVLGLRAEGIGTGWHFKAVHLHSYYRDRYGYRAGAFPVAESIAERTVSLPLSSALSLSDGGRVIESVRRVLGQRR